MGIIISAAEPFGHVPPIPVVVRLECDDASMMFCHGFADFRDPAGYVGAHAKAMAAGWMERSSPKGRLWLCPECSGKT